MHVEMFAYTALSSEKLLTTQEDTSSNSGFFRHQERASHHEADLSTIEDAPRAHPRVSRAHEDAGRARCHPGASRKGAGSPGCLIRSKAARRAYVLRRRSDFEAVLRSGSRIGTPNFLARIRGNEAARPRLGIIAGRKTAPRAVDRNRVRRLIRDAFRSAAQGGLGACDIAIQFRSDLRAADNAAIRAELRRLFDRLARQCPEARSNRGAE
jgi:ribonuclease P protein component